MAQFCRRRLALFAAAAVATLFAPSVAQAQNLLTNGSFETGNFTGTNPQGAAQTTQLFNGATSIDGWTVIDEMHWQGNGNPYGFGTTDGARAIDFTGYSDSAPHGGVTQTVNLIVGQQYRLTFDFGFVQGYSTPTISMIVSSDNVNFTTFTNTLGQTGSGVNRYQSYTYDFTATLAATPITLRGANTNLGSAALLDNVSLTAVGSASAPEPATLALLGLGVAPFVGGIARRRKA